MNNLGEEPVKPGAASAAAKHQWDSLREDLAEASATRLTGALRRISEEADDLAAALGAPREDKYEIWSALYGADLTIFAEKEAFDLPGFPADLSFSPLTHDDEEPLAGQEVVERLEAVWAKETPQAPIVDALDGEEGLQQDRFRLEAVESQDFLTEARRLNDLGDRARERGDHATAEQWFDTARSVLLRIPGGIDEACDIELARSHLALVDIAYLRGKVKQAIAWAAEGLYQIKSDCSLVRERVRFLIWLAELDALRGLPADAAAWLQQARERLRDSSVPSDASTAFLDATILRVEGMINVRSGDWPTALTAFHDSLQIARNSATISSRELLLLEAFTERDLCYLCVRQGALEEAITHSTKSFDLRHQLGHGARAAAHRHAQIADVYRAMSNDVDERLRDALFSAIEGYELLGDDLDIARMHIRLARLCRKDKQPRQARYWAGRALQFGVRSELPLYQALAHRQLGLALEMESNLTEASPDRKQSLLEQADDHLVESLTILATLQDGFEYAMSQRAFGAMLARRAQGNPDLHLSRAKALLEEARKTFRALGAVIELEKTGRALALVFALEEAKRAAESAGEVEETIGS